MLGYYNNYLRGNNYGGLVYVFCGRGIKPGRQRIHGYFYDPAQKKWQHGEFLYPYAVIDRCYRQRKFLMCSLQPPAEKGLTFFNRVFPEWNSEADPFPFVHGL
ncbi:hypothetical protein TherJR_0265 [Thermincola potens JR]|uniref:Uncharacterized protein n=1 Tax=Thermincola potens (strain JR) TaxID=635013 RepID=D5X9T1_THEPJ|nr:hypothetical protein TherJR_0265 [Thermincola potens JR]